GPAPTLRFADASRPSEGEEWDLRSYALEADGPVPTAVLPDVPAPGGNSPLLLSTRARRRDRDPVAVTEAAGIDRAGAGVVLRIARVTGADQGHRRGADGTWTALTTGPRTGPVLSNLVLVGPTLVRLERTATGCAVAQWVPGDIASRWSSAELDLSGLPDADQPDVDPPVDGPALTLTGHDDTVLLVAPVRNDAAETPGLGLWRISGLAAPPRSSGWTARRRNVQRPGGTQRRPRRRPVGAARRRALGTHTRRHLVHRTGCRRMAQSRGPAARSAGGRQPGGHPRGDRPRGWR
ncbi:hypothetical protein, partial [Mycolicibacterium mageritense]|uniref:hypothetical protein n=1 Tax=Mycolicibacterium mageritense TaxID=53462 RepID=UPI001E50B9E4